MVVCERQRRNEWFGRFKDLTFFGVKNLRTIANWVEDKTTETWITVEQRYHVTSFAFKRIVIFVENGYEIIEG